MEIETVEKTTDTNIENTYISGSKSASSWVFAHNANLIEFNVLLLTN